MNSNVAVKSLYVHLLIANIGLSEIIVLPRLEIHQVELLAQAQTQSRTCCPPSAQAQLTNEWHIMVKVQISMAHGPIFTLT